MDRVDPITQRLIASFRAALATFDRADQVSPDRHADGCPCELCAFVRSTRELVAEFDRSPEDCDRAAPPSSPGEVSR